ncbi:MAG: type IX secretion system membrane protein PorP/SprF [Cyclobacteriaceae bacterium]|nr:type IX secretion system membrane protein PorP/SprF [Cyclobacteriaceae bacterium]MCX7638689.1 type IX secretion system membrane protein PorP/SprF [Cyclobacteriaceae bacterium]MDW8332411.1 type IX secretion system membrane protein PorP/SprF [Cyclobacteriaceae bacterium]
MKKTLSFFLFTCSATLTLHAQQDPLYAQYLTTPLLINPAYTGYARNLSGSVAYRKQWANFDGSPETFNAAGSLALADNKMGIGMIALQDKIGSDITNEFQFTYGYHVSLKQDMRLSFGLQGGMVNYRTDYSGLTINPDDPKFTNQSEWHPTIGAGVILSNEKFFFSASMPKMLKRSTDADSLATGLYNQNFYALGAYVWQMSHRIKFKPWVLLRGEAKAPFSYDVGVAMTADNSYTLAVFTRDLGTLGFMAQIELGDHFRFGYVFELPTAQSVGTRFTTHELMLGARMRLFRFHDISSIRNF